MERLGGKKPWFWAGAVGKIRFGIVIGGVFLLLAVDVGLVASGIVLERSTRSAALSCVGARPLSVIAPLVIVVGRRCVLAMLCLIIAAVRDHRQETSDC